MPSRLVPGSWQSPRRAPRGPRTVANTDHIRNNPTERSDIGKKSLRQSRCLRAMEDSDSNKKLNTLIDLSILCSSLSHHSSAWRLLSSQSCLCLSLFRSAGPLLMKREWTRIWMWGVSSSACAVNTAHREQTDNDPKLI